MPTSDEALGIVDRPHLPRPDAPNREDFKEWYHFNVVDPAQGTDIIINLSLAGDVTRAGHGKADVIALCHQAPHGWSGTIDTYDGSAGEFRGDRLDMAIGPNRLAFIDGVYRLSIQLRDQPFIFEAQFVPRSEPLMIWNDTPLGSGRLNWLVVPRLVASGRLSLAGQTYLFEGVPAYHDHNWGAWKWGDDFSWDWGFAISPDDDSRDDAFTVVFDRTANRTGNMVFEQTLAIWRRTALAKLFTRQMIRVERSGRLTTHIPRIPGAIRLIETGQVLNIPALYRISARDESDWLDFEYRPDAGLQIGVPKDYGFGLMGLNETFGNWIARGEVGGESVSFAARACLESLS